MQGPPPPATQPATVSPKDYVLGDKVAKNGETLGRMRTFVAVVAGIMAGVLGLTGLWGALFYVVVATLAGQAYSLVACGGQPDRFFAHGEQSSMMANITGAMMTYVLAWMLSYDAIYVF
uniref:ER membrane protein complex subunit 6 n=1 Tax=Neobodo designis TaxID=312471 RepID=A0A7S1W5W3_NEODS